MVLIQRISENTQEKETAQKSYQSYRKRHNAFH